MFAGCKTAAEWSHRHRSHIWALRRLLQSDTFKTNANTAVRHYQNDVVTSALCQSERFMFLLDELMKDRHCTCFAGFPASIDTHQHGHRRRHCRGGGLTLQQQQNHACSWLNIGWSDVQALESMLRICTKEACRQELLPYVFAGWERIFVLCKL